MQQNCEGGQRHGSMPPARPRLRGQQVRLRPCEGRVRRHARVQAAGQEALDALRRGDVRRPGARQPRQRCAQPAADEVGRAARCLGLGLACVRPCGDTRMGPLCRQVCVPGQECMRRLLGSALRDAESGARQHLRRRRRAAGTPQTRSSRRARRAPCPRSARRPRPPPRLRRGAARPGRPWRPRARPRPCPPPPAAPPRPPRPRTRTARPLVFRVSHNINVVGAAPGDPYLVA